MGCATTTVKIASIIFNILLAIISICGVIWISFNPDYFREDLSIGYYITSSLCIVFAVLGIYATIRESVCLAATCAVFLMVLTLLTIAVAIIGVSSSEHSGVEVVKKAWDRNSMDDLQTNHDCCGKSSAHDYILMNKAIPNSCYLNQDHSAIHNLFTEGCIEKMVKYYEEESYRFSIFLWLCVAFEFFGFLLTTFLVISFRNSQRRMQF